MAIAFAGQHEGDPKVIEVFWHLSLRGIISNILDAVFFGFSVGKWREEVVPADIVGKPLEWFIFTKDN